MLKKSIYWLILCNLIINGQCCYAANIFDITINNYGTADSTLIAAIDQATLLAENEVLKKIPNSDQQEFFQSMGNASSFAGKDLNNDIINTIPLAMISVGAGGAIDLNKKTLNDLKDSNGDTDWSNAPGVGAQLSLTMGFAGKFMPKKHFRQERWALFLNYFPIAYSKEDIHLKLRTGGFHLRYEFWKGKEVLPWGFFSLEPAFLTFGYEYNHLEGYFEEQFAVRKTYDSANAAFDATGRIDLQVTTHSFPLTLSSGIRLLHLFTLYGGLGADMNSGYAKGKGSLTNSNVTITHAGGTATGTASLDLGQEAKPTFVFTRYFLGAQINLWKFKVFAQGQKEMSRNLYGAQAGLKFIF
jgi:hypothetical protein